jgi:diacylglycerol kinase family enzyme
LRQQSASYEEVLLERTSPFLIVNPASGGYCKGRIAHLVATLRRAGLSPRVHAVRNPAEALVCGRAIRQAGQHPFVIVATGDGTFNAMLNGLGPGGATLAILPLGTANVLAAELGIRSLEEGLRRIIRGESRPVSVGCAATGQTERYFCLMAGSGLDGRVARGVRPGEKRFLKQGAYALSAVRTLFNWDWEVQEVVAAGETVVCHTAVVCNVSRYGGNFRLAPESSLFSPGFTVVCITGTTRRGYLGLARDLLLGRSPGGAGVRLLAASEVEIRGAKAIQLDGDFAGHGPVRIRAVPDFAELIV